MDARYDPRHAGQACCRAYRHNRRVRRVAQARYVSRKKRNRSVIMGQEWRDPGGVAAASRFRAVADVFAGGTGKRDSEIARSLSQPWMRLSRKSKPQQGVRPGLATNPA